MLKHYLLNVYIYAGISLEGGLVDFLWFCTYRCYCCFCRFIRLHHKYFTKSPWKSSALNYYNKTM